LNAVIKRYLGSDLTLLDFPPDHY